MSLGFLACVLLKIDWSDKGLGGHSLAVLLHTVGLAVLNECELNIMSQEMEKKFNHLSELLVLDLQVRDKLVTELSVKNKFISAILRVKSLKHTLSGGMDSAGRPRSRSTRSKPIEDRVNEKVSGIISKFSGKQCCILFQYLSSIIPYCPPEGNSWRIDTLLTLIESKYHFLVRYISPDPFNGSLSAWQTLWVGCSGHF